ncbi:uncharacterized protein [Linepithema humile]|uniref:uncharacterized protein n=1 Tax=Linepithema humile TaxID=83485 RepID=UPI00062349E1|nr:PREDICTED: uncharacterized protein LOC105674940 [Linepithema humile]
MSFFNDFHQFSDISSISTNSYSSNRLIERIDSVYSSLDNHSSIIKSSNKSSTSQEINANEKVVKSLVLCEESINEHIKANIVYQCVKEASLNHSNILSRSTASKLQALLLIHELDKYMHLPSSTKYVQDDLTLLGITNLPASDLTLDEKSDVRCCIETILRERIHDMLLRYETIGGNAKKVSKNNECDIRSKFLDCHDVPALHWWRKIEEYIQQYESDLLKYASLIDKWNKLKYEDLNQAYLDKTTHLLLQVQVSELQAKITKLSCTIRMFKETPITKNAFKMINQLIEDKLNTVMDEIRQKEDLKKLYDNLKNTEYDQVLKNYTQLCNAIKKKKQLLDMIK